MEYECARCGQKTSLEYIEEMLQGKVRCRYCGYRVLKKMRPPVVKRVRTD